MQSVSVYLRDASYFLVVIHGSGGGDPCISSGPVTTLPANVDAQLLGAAVLAALSQSTLAAPWPTDWKKIMEPLLLAAKAKTWSAFAKRATNVRVDRTPHEISVSPNLRDKASFVHIPEKVVRLVTPDAANLGSVVVAALLAEQ